MMTRAILNGAASFVILSLGLCTFPGEIYAATFNAASASYADVSAAVSAASSGDTVRVPAGSATWSSQLNISKGIILQGAGIGQTVITSSIGDGYKTFLISYVPANPALNEPFELSGFTLDGAMDVNPPGSGMLFLYSNSVSTAITRIKVHDNKFQNGFSRAISMPGLEFGVFYNNQFQDNGIAIYVGNNEQIGWNYALTQGGANYPFFENNTFTQTIARGGFIVETGRGGRIVFRNNTITGYGGAGGEVWDAHGGANPPTDNGTVSAEYYNNTITVLTALRVFFHRGGKAIVFNNTVTGGGANNYIGLTEYQGWYFCTAAPYPKPQQINNTLYWNNSSNGSNIVPTLGNTSGTNCNPPQPDSLYIQQGRDYWLPAPGLDAAKPGACTVNSYYGATDTGKLYVCNPINTWTLLYTPYSYPHPLRGTSPLPGSPSGLLIQ